MNFVSLRTALSALALVLTSATAAMADTGTVPEPATMSLAAIGAGLYLINRRRRK